MIASALDSVPEPAPTDIRPTEPRPTDTRPTESAPALARPIGLASSEARTSGLAAAAGLAPAEAFHAGRLLIATVGVPATGKTSLSRALDRYLRWLGVPSEVFSLGDHRRQTLGKPGQPDVPPVCPLFNHLILC